MNHYLIIEKGNDMKTIKKIVLTVVLGISGSTIAQNFDVDLQLRPRFEFRNGVRSPLLNSDDATSFIEESLTRW